MHGLAMARRKPLMAGGTRTSAIISSKGGTETQKDTSSVSGTNIIESRDPPSFRSLHFHASWRSASAARISAKTSCRYCRTS